MRTLFFGFEVKLLDGWEENLPEVQAPSNYKDAIKIAEYIEKAKGKQREDAIDNPLCTRISRVTILNPLKKQTYTIGDFREVLSLIGEGGACEIQMAYDTAFPHITPVIMGLDIKEYLRTFVLSMATFGLKVPFWMTQIPSLHAPQFGVIDPTASLVPGMSGKARASSLVKRLNLANFDMTNSGELASVAMDIATKVGSYE